MKTMKALLSQDDLAATALVDLAGLFTASDSDEAPSDEDLLAMMDLYAHLNEVALCVAYLQVHAFGKSSCVVNHAVKDDVQLVISRLCQVITEANSLLRADAYRNIAATANWVITTDRAEEWLRCAAVYAHVAKFEVVGRVLEECQATAKTIGKCLPSYSHFINDEVYHARMAKKQWLTNSTTKSSVD